MSFAKYDIEMLLSDLKDVLVAHMNDKITAINVEKNDTITLSSIDDNAFFFQDLDQKEVQYNPFVFYCIDDMETAGIYGASADIIKIMIMVIVLDAGMDLAPSQINRMLRYQRCIKEVIEENFQLNQNGVKLEIQNKVPVSFEKKDSSDLYRVIGVELQARLPG